MEDVYVDTADGRFAAIDFGGHGPDVLLLHQIASDAQVWVTIGPLLARFSHPVALDLCGHGRTRAHDETAARLIESMPRAVIELGLRNPLVVCENEEMIHLFRQAFAQLHVSGVVVVAPTTSARGEDAESEFTEILGSDAVDVWDERNAMFATGAPHEREAFLDHKVATAGADWLNEGISTQQLRAYVERQLRDTPDGWERIPRRPLVEEVLELIGQGPFGLDLLDEIDGPAGVVVDSYVTGADDAARYAAWAQERADRFVAVLPGYGPPDSFEPEPLADFVRRMLPTDRPQD